MNQEKHIDKQAVEEMAKELCQLDRDCEECSHNFMCQATKYANRAYDADYRKQIQAEWFPYSKEIEMYDETKKQITGWLCGNCKKYSAGLKNFCSYCGAKMMGGV